MAGVVVLGQNKRFKKEETEESHWVVKNSPEGEGDSKMPSTTKPSVERSVKPSLSSTIIKKYEGQCVGIIDGKVVASGNDAGKVLTELKAKRKQGGHKALFACIPKSSSVIVR